MEPSVTTITLCGFCHKLLILHRLSGDEKIDMVCHNEYSDVWR
jgi:hypothetical protein